MHASISTASPARTPNHADGRSAASGSVGGSHRPPAKQRGACVSGQKRVGPSASSSTACSAMKTVTSLGPAARALLRKLGALPALVAAAGWPRPLSVPQVAQLGYYPPHGARYAPHLDRPAHEAHNRKELTFLVYCNVGWDADAWGGHLRVHPSSALEGGGGGGAPGRPPPPPPLPPGGPPLPLAPARAFDVAPLAGRLVVFRAGDVCHEVLPSSGPRGRLALTLWVEYESE